MIRPLITDWDELLIHQTAAPVAEAATSDHRFFDRVVVLGHDPDDRYAVLLGLAVYKNLNVMEGFACVRDGLVQHNLRLSRSLRPEGPTLEIGPLRFEVEIPLRRLRATLGCGSSWSHAFDLTFESPLAVEAEEPHRHEHDGRRVEDFIRYHQLGSVSGGLRIEDDEHEVASWFAMRDHSWGVRPGVGGFEPRSGSARRTRPSARFGFLAFVTPDVTGQFELREEIQGEAHLLRGHVLDRRSAARAEVTAIDHRATIPAGSDRFTELDLRVHDAAARTWVIRAWPAGRAWVFRGTGYDRGYLDGRGLGWWRGDDVVEADTYDLSDVDDVMLAPGAEPLRTWHREQPVHLEVDGQRGEGHVFWSEGS